MTDTMQEPKLYLSVLEQTEVWRDVNGTVRPLADLDTSHLENLIPFLRKHGEALRFKWLRMMNDWHFAEVPTVINSVDGKDILGKPMPIFSDGGGNLDDARDEWVDFEMDRPFDEWLEDRPLVKAIRAELKRRPPVNLYNEQAPF